MKRALFVMEKWCDTTPKLGFTNTFHYFVNTFVQNQFEYHVNTLHIDECAIVYGANIDTVLLNYCKTYPTDIIFYSYVGPKYHPSIECWKKLREMGIYICFIWHDSNPTDVQAQEQNYEITDLQIIFDKAVSDFHNQLPQRAKEIRLFCPQDETLYFPDVQTIPVSFVGSLRDPARAMFMRSLASAIPEMVLVGGQREANLPPPQYAKFIRTSKIGLNFAYHPFGYWQTKSRVYEIIASKSMLLESSNLSTRTTLTPGRDYIEYTNIQDAWEKIQYYLANEQERLEIAANGYNMYCNHYSSKHFWDAVMERINAKI